MTDLPDAAAAAGELRLPPFATLRAYEAVVRLGGIRRAAQSLGLHHSVVSRHLTRLEASLGIALLCRSGKRFAVTPEGERFHARISTAISGIALAVSEVRGDEAARPIRIRCSHGLSIQWFAARVAAFERANPHMRLDLRPSDEPANLSRHEADVNIFMHHEDEIAVGVGEGLKAQVLARPLAIITASPALAAKLPGIATPRNLLDVPLLHGRHAEDWRRWFEGAGVPISASLSGELCWHPYMALEAARLGRGLLLTNRFFVERELARGELVELRVLGIANRPFGGYLFVAREDRWTEPRLVALRRFLLVQMKSMERVNT